jgi:hypothetical protein
MMTWTRGKILPMDAGLKREECSLLEMISIFSPVYFKALNPFLENIDPGATRN